MIVLAFASPVTAYDIVNRWTTTQLDGGGLQRGDPVTLRWSVVPDGESYSRSANSQLIDYLDDAWNVPFAQRVPDLTGRPWWNVVDRAYDQFARVSGVTMVYVPEQHPNGSDTGLIGDIRIGGENIDGTPGGALADNTFPNDGDMRIDTSREANGQVSYWHSNEVPLRNLVIHESGHGVGLGHTDITGAKAVMEGGIRTDIWGLQFDDVYALNRQYGDPLERDGRNDAPSTATLLGNFATTGAISVGMDAVDSVVDEFDDDWVGIDGTSDVDWFRFSVTGEAFANVTITPIGPSYSTEQQGAINAAAMSDLYLQFFSDSPTLTLLETVDQHGLGLAETLAAQLLPTAGQYLLRVRGHEDVNQFYQLDLSLSELPLPGTSADINLDGETTIADWSIFVANSYTSLAGYSQRDAFGRGDLDLDGDNDRQDFQLFKAAFDASNGVGALARLLQVPEPGTVLLFCTALIGCCAARRWK